MIKRLPLTDVDKEYELEYYNPVGLLFKNQIFIHDYQKILEFDIQEIKHLTLKKERDLKVNFVLFCISSFLLIVTLFLKDIVVLYRFSSFGFAALFLLAAMAKKTYQYKIILLTDHSHYFTVPIDEAYKDDAFELLAKAKIKMETNKFYLKAI